MRKIAFNERIQTETDDEIGQHVQGRCDRIRQPHQRAAIVKSLHSRQGHLGDAFRLHHQGLCGEAARRRADLVGRLVQLILGRVGGTYAVEQLAKRRRQLALGRPRAWDRHPIRPEAGDTVENRCVDHLLGHGCAPPVAAGGVRS